MLTELLDQKRRRHPPEPWECHDPTRAQEKDKHEGCDLRLYPMIRETCFKIDCLSMKRMTLSNELNRLRLMINILRKRCSGLTADLLYKIKLMNNIMYKINKKMTEAVSD
jgi:hypothetical protein